MTDNVVQNDDENTDGGNSLLTSDEPLDITVSDENGNPDNEGQDKDKDSQADKSKDEDADKKDGAPENYEDFKMPDGMELDKERMEAFLPIAKELNLSQDKAQKLVDFYATAVKDITTQQQQMWADTLDEWKETAVSDSEYGGKKFQESIVAAKRALDTFGSKKLREALDQTGMGNHPELIRMLVKVGTAVSNDKFEFGKSSAQDTVRDPAKILYPNMN